MRTLKPLRAAVYMLPIILTGTVARAQYNPVALTPSSFQYDIVVEKGAPAPLQNYVTATVDAGTNVTGNTLCEQGFDPSLPWLGLPNRGTTFNSLIGGHSYVMPPDMTTNNVAAVMTTQSGTNLFIHSASASLKAVTPPPAYQYLSILYCASGGNGIVDVTVTHQDGSVEAPQQISIKDWFAGSGEAYRLCGRIQVDNNNTPMQNIAAPSGTPHSPSCYNADITLANNTSPVTNITFTFDATGTVTNYRFFALAVSGSTDNSTFTPIPVYGYNYRGIVSSNAQNRCFYATGYTVTMDQGPSGLANTFYEQGFATVTGGSNPLNVGTSITPAGTTGFPHPNTTLNSTQGSTNYSFLTPASYAGPDCVFVGNYITGAQTNGNFSSPDYTTGSFTITSPQPYIGFSILDSAGNGPAVLNYTVKYNNGTTESGSMSVLNWFQADGSLVYSCAGRLTPNGPTINNLNGGSPTAAIYHNDIILANPSLTATNISFSWASGGRAALFAVSATTDGSHYTPIAVTGYDADVIVEKEQPFYHGGLYTATDATMDQGTNNSNFTLFEQGWITNGVGSPGGMPPAGSTIASLQASNRFYKIQTYTGPNGVLVNSSHTNSVITPVSPTNYSAFSILVAGGNIAAGGMTNLCILQHQDGVNETNTFIAYDWFNASVLPAFICNGRMDTRAGLGVNLGTTTGNPRLFESFFQLADVGSPVTNIILRYSSGGGSAYVMAVSATAGAVQPFLGLNNVTPASPVFEGSNVVMTASVGGTAPVTNQWQFSVDGVTWVNLVDGGNISGSSTTNATAALHINPAVYSNSGQYRVVAFNAAGGVTNTPITYNVYSTLPDVTVPTDPIVAYEPSGGSSPTGSEPIHAIENLVGTNSDYVNIGNGPNPPFSGPVGFIVTPATGKTTVTAARFYTTELTAANDPANWTLEGSLDGGATWSPITTNVLALPAGRNSIAAAAVNPLTQVVRELHFGNGTGYTSYRVTFYNTANDAAATAIGIGEVELLGTNTYAAPVIAQQPGNATVWVGGNPTFTVVASGAPPPLTYQWSRGTVAPIGPIAGATTSSYTLVNAQLSDSGATFSCTVGDGVGSTPSTSGTLTVSGTKPTEPYPVAVMADNPLAYWRLDEPEAGGGNNGLPAYDKFGGFIGSYSNTVLSVNGYNPPLDSDTAAQFGSSLDSYVGNIMGIDFSAPTNTAATLSVEAWVLVGGTIPINGAGIITKGYGGGGEQFNLDTGSSGSSAKFRFFVRDAGGNSHGNANGTIGPTNQLGPFPNANGNGYSWHHVVGVCDEPHSSVILYIDGISNAAATGVLPSNGLLSSPFPVSIGSRTPNIYTDYTNQFDGTIDEVAIYKQALTPAQVLAHYYAAHPNPVFTLMPPATANYSANGPLVLNAAAYGPPALTFQWWQSPDQGTWTSIPGQNSSNFNMASTPAGLGPYLYLVATDPYGATTSSVVQITAYSSGPVFVTDLVPTNLVYAGGTVAVSVQAFGLAPLGFQWYKSADNVTYTPLSDNSHISGSHTNTLSITAATAADNAYYKVIVSNSVSTAESVHEYLIVEGRPDFNGNGLGWNLISENPPVNGGASIVNNVLTLTDGTAGENRAAWYNYPLYIGAFKATFTYQDIGGNGADGMSFCLQNDTRGTSAIGGGGGGLAYTGITPSAALLFNIYSGAAGGASGILLGTNGVGVLAANPYQSTAPVNIDAGNPVNVTVVYVNGIVRLTLNDTVANTTFNASIPVDISSYVGGQTAYVGLTGSEGGTLSHQTVSNFVYAPLPVLTAQQTGPTTVVLSWPSIIGGYILQSKADLGDTNPNDWVTVANPVTQSGGQNHVTISPLAAGNNYRLVLPGNQE